jgi:hypothetical protein
MSKCGLVAILVKASAVVLLLVGTGQADVIVPCNLPDTIQGPVVCLASGNDSSVLVQSTSTGVVAPDEMTINGWNVAVVGLSNSPNPNDPATGFGLFVVFTATCGGDGPSDDCARNPLHVLLSDTGFFPGISPSILASTLAPSQDGGTSTLNAWYDPSDQFFRGAGLIGTEGPTVGPFTGMAIGSTLLGATAGQTPYSLTIEGTFDDGCIRGDDCQDASITAVGYIIATDVPEPGVTVLFGTSVIMLYAATLLRRWRVRRRRLGCVGLSAIQG